MTNWREQLTQLFPALAHLSDDSYVVGGAIRDLLLGRTPADADVACLDPLTAARRVSPRVIRLGNQEHLSAYRVVLPNHIYDFAALLDGHIDADLARRDFTINAMAVDLRADELLDPHGGQRDVAARTVRMVRPENFDDDPLRTLKAIRMAVKYDFTIDDATIAAIRSRAHRITEVATERVLYELTVILSSNALRKAVALFDATALAEPLGLHLRALHADEVPLAAALALLVDDPRASAERWRWSDALLHDVLALQHLVDHHDRIALFDAGESVARQLPPLLRALGRDDALDFPDFTTRALLTGNEIAQLANVPRGPELGALKRALLEAQLRGEVVTRADAERYVGESTVRPPAGRPGRQR
ncbi:MAG: CCA tRNA nucleotidyltransferase [Acidobacteria bacterium]|nr:CCA tRNA nucleotidyltransferase [Acidobacteriota bacterium]MBV9476251.1 CCA tRNA nucleotidyltransferase [Acidobacteriota bacterium]